MKTLHIKLPIGQTLIQALLGLAIFLSLLEGAVRIPLIKNQLAGYEFYGSSHPHFDAQVRSIRARAETSGKIDCIFIGSSQIFYGVDPAIVEDTYYKKTGQKITCQNFGLGGLAPTTALPLIKILIRDYHPSIIIMGAGIFDYSLDRGNAANASIMASPWLKYKMGNFSIDGWLIENSPVYRDYLGMDQYILNQAPYPSDIEANGHSIAFSNNAKLTIDQQVAYFADTLPTPSLNKDQINAAQSILKFQNSKTKFIIIETPVTPKIYSVQRKIKMVHPKFVETLKVITEQAKVELWLTQLELNLPEDGWYDLIHLNKTGTAYFSAFIGEKLSETYHPGK